LTDKIIIFKATLSSSERLDKTLVHFLPDLTRSRIQSLIKGGLVKVNSKPIEKNSWFVNSGDDIEVILPEPMKTDIMAEDIPLDVIFENEDLAVINKAAGMVVHPAVGHLAGTLVNAALAEFDDLEGINGELRPGIVHRLDKETSGIIIIAKNEKTLIMLQNQFKDRQVQKVYFALVDGKPPTPVGRVEAAIARDPLHRKKMAIVSPEKGRHAETEYRIVETFAMHTLVEAYPKTGRTHQIRLHMALLKCPIVGDKVYGRIHPSIDINRHFLHAAKLSITIPGESIQRTFEAPLPEELVTILDNLRKS
jgi:23S rRNA pseudouridine1911/1915/1917 synthase